MTALDLAEFVDETRGADPITCAGGRTQWHVGGELSTPCRVVRPPAGIVSYEPAEMTVRLGAGTSLDELHHTLAGAGQTTALEGAPGATVGGVLAVGHDGVRTRRVGRVRDVLLQARVVLADGRVITAGGPTVKNVTGFDLCRVLVGSLGALGFVGEVIVRTRPLPRATRWLAGVADPLPVAEALYRPAAVLWDGITTWVLLEGYERDVEAQASVLAALGLAAAAPPDMSRFAVRSSLSPTDLLAHARRAAPGSFLAEVGVGVVHTASSWGRHDALAPSVARLQQRIKTAFDPTNRLNPGRLDSTSVGVTS